MPERIFRYFVSKLGVIAALLVIAGILFIIGAVALDAYRADQRMPNMISVRVVDAKGKPVAGIPVELYKPTDLGGLSKLNQVRATDGDGRCWFHDRREERVTLEVGDAEHGWEVCSVSMHKGVVRKLLRIGTAPKEVEDDDEWVSSTSEAAPVQSPTPAK